MRPDIADLIRPNIYKVLNDAPNVSLYKDVLGVDKNVFFIAHDQHEDFIADGKTKVSFIFL